MLNDALVRRLERRQAWLFAAIWLAGCAMLLALSFGSIRQGLFPDPDDTLRLVQVRDWLAGQSWFDVTQYRMNPPQGVAMHWSRFVDVPIAATMLVLRPVLGVQNAELAALVLVPLLTLAVVMALVMRLSARLTDPVCTWLALLGTPISVGALSQLRPMRIDHHGWQIALALLATLAALDERPRRSGLIAGAAAAMWLNISVEGLPFAAALGALFALRWIVDPAADERLRAYLASLAGSSLLLFALTRWPSLWGVPACDAVSSAHLAAFGAAAVVGLAAVRKNLRARWLRVAILGGVGAAAIGALLIANPQCAHDPFASLDPLVRKFWYERVLEGLPIWQQPRIVALSYLALPLVGLAGAWIARRDADGPHRTAWENYFFLLAAATVATILVTRVGAEANCLALPGAAFLCAEAIRKARALKLAPTRIVATVAAVFTLTPASAVAIVGGIANGNTQGHGATPSPCTSASQMRPLARLPLGDVAAPLDVSPAILVYTPHRVIASGHHRNQAGMRDAIRLFSSPPKEAATIISRRDIEYLVVCPTLPEPHYFATMNRQGLWSNLEAGKPVPWLERLQVPGVASLEVWRVRKDRLPAARAAGAANSPG